MKKKIIIQGLTKKGKHFRPSDWAERVSGTLATFKNNRIYYSQLLEPKVHKDGYRCVVLDPQLKESSPKIYQSIIDFAQENNLSICDNDD